MTLGAAARDRALLALTLPGTTPGALRDGNLAGHGAAVTAPSNLDAKLRVQMRTEVSRIQQRLGTTCVYVTHDQTEATASRSSCRWPTCRCRTAFRMESPIRSTR